MTFSKGVSIVVDAIALRPGTIDLPLEDKGVDYDDEIMKKPEESLSAPQTKMLSAIPIIRFLVLLGRSSDMKYRLELVLCTVNNQLKLIEVHRLVYGRMDIPT
jgi:hypothetical protein